MKIKNILVSQTPPLDFEKSPYADLKKKYSINIEFFKFFKFSPVSAADFRKTKINILDHTAIIFSSTTTIDYFFTLLKEMRLEIPESMKYFCPTDQVAYYLQKYISYKKRKVFYAKNNSPSGVFELISKNRDLKYLLPCGSEMIYSQYCEFLNEEGIEHNQAVVFNTVPAEFPEKFDISQFDMIVFFSNSGVASLKSNYPDFEQGEMAFAALGSAAADAVRAEGWTLHVEAPTKEAPSITIALDHFLKEHATRRR
ncbi:MAG TPA: uroporphyrinogen-III synthase [Bacteroidales bacterium]|nr:uroporphyrinogen-III synthase [Bacteroidales bacterium]HPZ02680.1 uroporphyrinogen-III synthase [Bacteroidales bacterium]HQB74420.1 uroporphyrinogen-III synthase [Bacteroidales bacterium]